MDSSGLGKVFSELRHAHFAAPVGVQTFSGSLQLINKHSLLILFLLWCQGAWDKSLLLCDKGSKSQSLALPEIYASLKTKILTKRQISWHRETLFN